jgi:hypothetical protein
MAFVSANKRRGGKIERGESRWSEYQTLAPVHFDIRFCIKNVKRDSFWERASRALRRERGREKRRGNFRSIPSLSHSLTHSLNHKMKLSQCSLVFCLCILFVLHSSKCSASKVETNSLVNLHQIVVNGQQQGSPLMVGVGKINATLPIGTPLGIICFFCKVRLVDSKRRFPLLTFLHNWSQLVIIGAIVAFHIGHFLNLVNTPLSWHRGLFLFSFYSIPLFVTFALSPSLLSLNVLYYTTFLVII